MRARRWTSISTLAVAMIAAAGPSARATSLPVRAFTLAPPDVAAVSTLQPVVASSGTELAFVLTPQAGGTASASGGQVFAFNVITGQYALVSPTSVVSPSGFPYNIAISADGQHVAYVASAATGISDVYVRDLTSGAATLVSVASNGGAANGSSYAPAISRTGRYVAFVSDASNLTAGDTNGVSDVFVRDLTTGRTQRVSVATAGKQADASSGAPAMSADGNAVSFTSAAHDLVPGALRAPTDVYVHDLASGKTRRASVSNSGAEQNLAVPPPFIQESSLSSHGGLISFDSNATNLVRGESPQARTEVFVRDLHTHHTTLVSENNNGFEANNDSFTPYITPNGRFVVFESFATDLALGGGPRENIFVRDLSLGTTSVMNVGPNGEAPGPEQGGKLLQRPTISGDGQVAAFTSTASNLTHTSTGLAEGFLRLMAPPHGFVASRSKGSPAPRVVVVADDPAASQFECQIDKGQPYPCSRGVLRFPAGLRPGRHRLLVRAGGPGMLYDDLGVTLMVRTGPGA